MTFQRIVDSLEIGDSVRLKRPQHWPEAMDLRVVRKPDAESSHGRCWLILSKSSPRSVSIWEQGADDWEVQR